MHLGALYRMFEGGHWGWDGLRNDWYGYREQVNSNAFVVAGMTARTGPEDCAAAGMRRIVHAAAN